MPSFVKLSQAELERLRRGVDRIEADAYPFAQLAVGEGFYISYEEYCARPRVMTPSLNSMFSTLKKQSRKYLPKQFIVTRKDSGFLVARVA